MQEFNRAIIIEMIEDSLNLSNKRSKMMATVKNKPNYEIIL